MEAINLNPSVIANLGSAAQKAEEPSRRDRFTDVLRTSIETHNALRQTQEKDLRDAANQLVSMAFLKPLLAQARQSPFKSDMFSGGQGEAAFQQQLDTILADRMAQRVNYSIGEAVYKQFAGSRQLSALSNQLQGTDHATANK